MTLKKLKELIGATNTPSLKRILEGSKMPEFQKEIKVELDKRKKIDKIVESWTK